jgi:tetratricopeptide (TPR) repeat protein
MGYGERWEYPIDVLYKSAKKGSTTDAWALMDKISREHISSPAVVVEIGGDLINTQRPNDKMWSVYEAVALSAASLGFSGWYQKCLALLQKKFTLSSSSRLARLQLQLIDAQVASDGPEVTQPKSVTDFIDKLVTQLEAAKEWVNVRRLLAHKRFSRQAEQASGSNQNQLALQCSSEVDEAIAALDSYGANPEPYILLSSRYLEQNHVARAAFCLEEVLMHDHVNVPAIVSYAEMQVALKDLDTARKYFAHACMLDPKHPRALWGLLSVNAQLIAQDRKGLSISADAAISLHKQTVKRLMELYEPLGKSKRHAVITLQSLKEMPVPSKGKQ